jgi:hypothetical protein
LCIPASSTSSQCATSYQINSCLCKYYLDYKAFRHLFYGLASSYGLLVRTPMVNPSWGRSQLPAAAHA